nr:FtsX-like permease family protein [Kibdelosporangium sp. MJ126-NF4]CEL21570.1 putative integral membrane protein [Kibdelosporangium sp. MJ126-NF4]CTQ95862.1 putative integral membrane protein [Kibdelosporangium sp. MJ126-NF4]
MISRVLNDIVLGARLTVAGGRDSLVRLALTAIGVGLGVTVLLSATSVPHMIDARNERSAARVAESDQVVPGVDPVHLIQRVDEYRGQGLQGYLVDPTGPRQPLVPGVDRLPGPGEAILSPGLVRLLDSPDGELLRPRFSQRVIGTIGAEGLTGPNELYFYIGSDTVSVLPGARLVSEFGTTWERRDLTTVEWLLIVLGATSFLIPVVVFVATSTRLAASVRDRRLAALRLIGAGGAQVRRIAAGEAFIGAIGGLFAGIGLFLLVRALVPRITVAAFRGGIFATDILPDWRLAVVIAIGLPVMAVAVAILSLRRTIIEPLGVVRQTSGTRRRLWWRLLPPVAGVGLVLASTGGRQLPLVAGITLLLTSVPVLLPWIVERVTRRVDGGWSPAFQLAIRRLQMDSGTAARVVAGVAVVLAGSIALQTVYDRTDEDVTPQRPGQVSASFVSTSLTQLDAFDNAIRSIKSLTDVPIRTGGQVIDNTGRNLSMAVVACASIPATPCADGDAFYRSRMQPPPDQLVPAKGQQVRFDDVRGAPQWTIPRLGALRADDGDINDLVVTPGALANAQGLRLVSTVTALPPPGDPAFTEKVRNAVGALGWNGTVYSLGTGKDPTYLLISRVLQIGAVITLLIAVASLIVVALEQMRERRRSLAVLTANGVPRSVLAKALLWQTSIPVAVAVAVATLAGLTLAALLLVATNQPVTFDWANVAISGGAALGSVLLVTALTLPTLWQATSTTALREV